MSLSLEHIDACVPITGLKAFPVKDDRLILQSQGNHSCVIDEKSGKLLAKLRTFKSYNVHGFLFLNQILQNEGSYVQVLAWGEYSLRLIDIFYANDMTNGHCKTSLTAASAEYLAPDWMLTGCTDESGNAYLVTGHNALLGLRVVNAKSSRYKKAVHLRQLVTGVKSALYSADVISLSTSHILIAAGTVFGEIIVWSCFLNGHEKFSDALGSIHHFFTGHEGSIFGVQISPEIPLLHGDQSGRLLASCSDDRTIRIWDISDCERKARGDPSAYSTDGFELRSTGFGTADVKSLGLGSESCVAKAFGHVSRIWGARFLPVVEAYQRTLKLVSHGEDATCVLWKLSWEKSSSQNKDFQLRQVSSFHNHTGRNIFSLEMYRVSPDTVIHTGGADGALKTLRINENENMANGSVDGTSILPRDVSKAKGRGSLRAYSFVSPDCFIATTVHGEIQLGQLRPQSEAKSRSKPQIFKEALCVKEDLRSFSAIAGLPHRGLALVCNAEGLIRLYNHETKALSNIAKVDQRIPGLYAADPESSSLSPSDSFSFLTSYANVDIANLFVVDTPTLQVHNMTVNLPRHFEVNCASSICGNRYLLLGSRGGAIAIYQVANASQPLQPLIVIRRVHGDASMAGVNKIVPFWSLQPSNDSHLGYFITCGRDGNYCAHELEVSGDSERLVSHRIVHRSSTSLGQNVVGAYFDPKTQDLMLYGFRNKHFVLWNESSQTEVACIDCGGARGNWDIHPGDGSADGVFIWTQAATLNAYRLPTGGNRPLRAGAHGREIKAMEVFNAADEENTIFATGSEDTTVRIFGPGHPQSESVWGAFKCLRVLKQATALQQVGFSKDRNFLFTSSGLEEFFVWRICSVPVFGFAAHLIATSPKDDPNSDLRVTSFDILDVKEQGSQQSFLICLTLSNSTIKIFHFSTSANDGRFILLARGTYTSNCLTQARFLRTSSTVSLITTSTDGHFTLWNLTPVLGPFYSISSSSLSVKQSFVSAIITPENINCESRFRIHGNSIKALDMVPVSETVSLVAAGGDDNALTLSLINTDFTGSELDASASTISIPDAHAASVTAVRVLQRQARTGKDATTNVLIASSGNDHRVKVWSVDMDLQKNGSDQIDVENVADQYSNVADISALDVVYGGSDAGTLLGSNSKILVCGVGMEMLSIKSC